MGIFKKAFTGAAALLLATAAFADNVVLYATGISNVPSPQSYTNAATSGRFSTDVDNYMAVNNWSKVEYDNFFTFLSYNASFTNNNNNLFNIGFAKDLFGLPLGFWFAGRGGDFSMSSLLSSDTGKEKNGYDYTADSGTTYDYAGAVRVGLGNLGIKATALYQPRDTNQYNKSDTSKDYYSQTDVWRFYGDVQVGLGDEASTHFEAGLYINTAKKTVTSEKGTGSNGSVDNSFTDLYLRGGSTLKGWGLDVDTRWRIYPLFAQQAKDANVQETGLADDLIKVTASKTWSVQPTDPLTIKAKLAVPLSFGIYSDEADGTKTGNDWSYASEHTHNIDLLLDNPSVSLGAVYVIRPEKFNFNVGTSFVLGQLGWNVYATGYREDTTSKSYKYTTTQIDFGWDSSAVNFNLSSGFTAFFGDKFTIDAEWNILANIFNSQLRTKVFDGSTVDSVIANIFLSQNIGLMFSLKM